MKQDWKPGTMIYPLPALLVSCGSTDEEGISVSSMPLGWR